MWVQMQPGGLLKEATDVSIHLQLLHMLRCWIFPPEGTPQKAAIPTSEPCAPLLLLLRAHASCRPRTAASGEPVVAQHVQAEWLQLPGTRPDAAVNEHAWLYDSSGVHEPRADGSLLCLQIMGELRIKFSQVPSNQAMPWRSQDSAATSASAAAIRLKD